MEKGKLEIHKTCIYCGKLLENHFPVASSTGKDVIFIPSKSVRWTMCDDCKDAKNQRNAERTN